MLVCESRDVHGISVHLNSHDNPGVSNPERVSIVQDARDSNVDVPHRLVVDEPKECKAHATSGEAAVILSSVILFFFFGVATGACVPGVSPS